MADSRVQDFDALRVFFAATSGRLASDQALMPPFSRHLDHSRSAPPSSTPTMS